MGEMTQPAVLTPRPQLAAAATGVVSETGHVSSYGFFTAPSTQVVFGCLLGLRAGDVVNGVMLRNNTAAAGTLPTTARFGIADSAGKMLAISGNLNALANWVAGPLPFPFASQYTAPADGGYYACFVVNGTWSVTQPSPLRNFSGTNAMLAYSTFAPPMFNWAAQTDLPAVNSSLTMTQGGAAIGYWMGFY